MKDDESKTDYKEDISIGKILLSIGTVAGAIWFVFSSEKMTAIEGFFKVTFAIIWSVAWLYGIWKGF